MRATPKTGITPIQKRLIAVVTSAVLAVGLAGCGGGANTDVVVDKPGVALYTTAASTVAIEIGATAVYKIGGGGGGAKFTTYTATSSNPDLLSVTLDVDTLTIQGKKSGDATVSVKDSAGSSVDIKVTVGNNAALAILAPASVSMVTGTNATYQIKGGNPPYTVVSSNVGIISPSISGSGDKLTLTSGLTAGGAQIAVYDAKGASAMMTGTVATDGISTALYTTAPGYISLSLGGVIPVYQVGGGTAPYTINSSAPDVVAVERVGNSFTVRGLAIGFGSIAVKDATGAVTTTNVSVVSGKVDTPFYSTAPSAVVLKQASTGTYAVAGGTPPYVVVSSDQGVAQATLTGNSLTVSGLSVGSANIVVHDAIGAVISFAVTVSSTTASQPSVALYSTAPGEIVMQTGTSSAFTVGGGTGPYTATSSNASVSTVAMSGSNMTIQAVSLGTSKIVIRDAVGGVTNVALTVASPTTNKIDLYTTAPSAMVAKVGSTYTYSVTGGTSPYTATSSNTAVATTSIVGSSLSIAGVASGTANMVIKDAFGTTLTIAVTVP